MRNELCDGLLIFRILFLFQKDNLMPTFGTCTQMYVTLLMYIIFCRHFNEDFMHQVNVVGISTIKIIQVCNSLYEVNHHLTRFYVQQILSEHVN